jgi:hypothetical protein
MSTAHSIRRQATDPGYTELVFAVVFVWGAGDLISSLLAFHTTGIHAEANPLIRTLFAYDPLLVVIFKGAVTLAVGLILLTYRQSIERIPMSNLWLGTMVGVGIAVVGINLAVAYTSL